MYGWRGRIENQGLDAARDAALRFVAARRGLLLSMPMRWSAEVERPGTLLGDGPLGEIGEATEVVHPQDAKVVVLEDAGGRFGVEADKGQDHALRVPLARFFKFQYVHLMNRFSVPDGVGLSFVRGLDIDSSVLCPVLREHIKHRQSVIMANEDQPVRQQG